MAFEYPEALKYTDSHEYASVGADGVVTVGITAFAVDQLGDIVFLELPAVGTAISKGEKFGTVESVKAVEDLKAPVSGEVIEANEPLTDSPEQLAEDPYGAAWLIKVQTTSLDELDEAMAAADYRKLVEGA